MTLQEHARRIDDLMVQQTKEFEITLEKYSAELADIDAFLKTDEAKSDRSENASYQLAVDSKQRLLLQQEDVENRLLAYQKGMQSLKSYVPTETVSIGTTVRLFAEGCEFIMKMVPMLMGSARIGALSVNTACGAVLLGKRVGDHFVVHAPKGVVEYTVLEIY